MDKYLEIIRWVGVISAISGMISSALCIVKEVFFQRPVKYDTAWTITMSFISLSAFAFITHEVIIFLTK